jgi:hypothetical protein
MTETGEYPASSPRRYKRPGALAKPWWGSKVISTGSSWISTFLKIVENNVIKGVCRVFQYYMINTLKSRK